MYEIVLLTRVYNLQLIKSQLHVVVVVLIPEISHGFTIIAMVTVILTIPISIHWLLGLYMVSSKNLYLYYL